MSNLVVSFVVEMVNKTVAPLKALVNDLTAVAKESNAAAAPIAGVGQSMADIAKPAQAAAAGVASTADALKDVVKPAQEAGESVAGAGEQSGEAGEQMETAGEKAKKFGAALGNDLVAGIKVAVVAAAGLAASAVAVGTGLSVWVRGQAQSAEATLNSAKAAGISADSYQRLQYAFDKTNLSGGALDQTIAALTKNMGMARAGNKAQIAAFHAAGVTIKDATGHYKSADVVFAQIADKFATITNGTQKAILAQKLFGESGAALIPLLEGGSKGLKEMGDKAATLGLIMSDKTLTASQKMNASWEYMTENVRGLGLQIFAGLLPPITSLIDKIGSIIAQNKDDILKGLTKGLNWLTDNMPAILDGIDKFVKFMRGIVKIGSDVVTAMGGINGVFDTLAVLMIGRLAIGLATTVASIWGVNAALYGCPVVWIIAGIAAIAATAYLLVRHWNTVSKWFSDFWTWLQLHIPIIPALFQPFIDTVKAMILAAKFLNDHWKEISDTITGTFDAVMKAWNGLPKPLRDFLSFVNGAVGKVVNPFAGIAEAASHLYVPDSERAIQDHGRHHSLRRIAHPELGPPVGGVTPGLGDPLGASTGVGSAAAPTTVGGKIEISVTDDRTKVTKMSPLANTRFSVDRGVQTAGG